MKYRIGSSVADKIATNQGMKSGTVSIKPRDSKEVEDFLKKLRKAQETANKKPLRLD